MHIPIFNKRRPLIFDIKLSKRKYKLVFLVDCCSNLQITISNNKYIISVCQIPSKATYNVSSAQKIEIFGSFGGIISEYWTESKWVKPYVIRKSSSSWVEIWKNFRADSYRGWDIGPRKSKNHRGDQALFWGEKNEYANNTSFERSRRAESNDTKINEIRLHMAETSYNHVNLWGVGEALGLGS